MTSSDQDVFWGPDFGALQSEDPQIASIILGGRFNIIRIMSRGRSPKAA